MDGGIVVSARDRRVVPAGGPGAERRDGPWLPPTRSALLLGLSVAIGTISVAGLLLLPIVELLRRVRWPFKSPARR